MSDIHAKHVIVFLDASFKQKQRILLGLITFVLLSVEGNYDLKSGLIPTNLRTKGFNAFFKTKFEDIKGTTMAIQLSTQVMPADNPFEHNHSKVGCCLKLVFKVEVKFLILLRNFRRSSDLLFFSRNQLASQ